MRARSAACKQLCACGAQLPLRRPELIPPPRALRNPYEWYSRRAPTPTTRNTDFQRSWITLRPTYGINTAPRSAQKAQNPEHPWTHTERVDDLSSASRCALDRSRINGADFTKNHAGRKIESQDLTAVPPRTPPPEHHPIPAPPRLGHVSTPNTAPAVRSPSARRLAMARCWHRVWRGASAKRIGREERCETLCMMYAMSDMVLHPPRLGRVYTPNTLLAVREPEPAAWSACATGILFGAPRARKIAVGHNRAKTRSRWRLCFAWRRVPNRPH